MASLKFYNEVQKVYDKYSELIEEVKAIESSIETQEDREWYDDLLDYLREFGGEKF